jgi:hypothetical protein
LFEYLNKMDLKAAFTVLKIKSYYAEFEKLA